MGESPVLRLWVNSHPVPMPEELCLAVRHRQWSNPLYRVPDVKHNPKLMAWGCLDCKRCRGLRRVLQDIAVKAYVYNALLQSKFAAIGSHKKFQQDRYPCHTASNLTIGQRKQHCCFTEAWRSPGFNHIENVRRMVNLKVVKRPQNPSPLHESWRYQRLFDAE